MKRKQALLRRTLQWDYTHIGESGEGKIGYFLMHVWDDQSTQEWVAVGRCATADNGLRACVCVSVHTHRQVGGSFSKSRTFNWILCLSLLFQSWLRAVPCCPGSVGGPVVPANTGWFTLSVGACVCVQRAKACEVVCGWAGVFLAQLESQCGNEEGKWWKSALNLTLKRKHETATVIVLYVRMCVGVCMWDRESDFENAFM